MLQSTLCSAVVALFAVSSAMGQFLDDGNFDDLDPGTPPNCEVDAGAWGWPQNYIDAGLCERLPGEFEIVVPTRGNSLHLNIDDPDPAFTGHLTNLLRAVIFEDPTQTVVYTAEVNVLNEGVAGGCIYVGGDHGGGGFSNASDRGPQICWETDGNIHVWDGGANPVVVESYPVKEWQFVRLEIDLTADNYDMFWGTDAKNLSLVGEDVPFRVPSLDFIDRITVVHFGGLALVEESLFDNFTIKIVCNADLDGSGEVDFGDILASLTAWGNKGGPEDLDGSGTVDFGDLLIVLAAWGPCV